MLLSFTIFKKVRNLDRHFPGKFIAFQHHPIRSSSKFHHATEGRFFQGWKSGPTHVEGAKGIDLHNLDILLEG